ncbi:methyltransferase domain-containing protein [Chitinophaga pendula]|uniref:methyltransferase domain-containing protein n=1 Tax=Chitinophaga TaxID=79328 RepID=UPI000BAE8BA7|nr:MULTISPECIES: methyltransferase domain-containing protein [Chitinophaga]ASZ14624.1 SAM-dependent methyltransferase [Chitinophaga sp. MD30]UCJ07725.1 methyltransferase domain-containing protein [Chitinophaga pendula]
MDILDANYWDNRYQQGQTEWDMGQVSPPLRNYIDQLTDKNKRICIPGGGNSYEADYLWRLGFTNITVLDISPVVTERLLHKFDGTDINVHNVDFFQHQDTYDLIIEQTFFCALDPALRPEYVKHIHQLLAPAGQLVGVLFDRNFPPPGPPFGGNSAEYRDLLSPYFNFRTFETCYNSHPARQDKELFINLVKK